MSIPKTILRVRGFWELTHFEFDGTWRLDNTNQGGCAIENLERDDVQKLLELITESLENKGYTYHGGELWKPPLGKPPNFDLIDELDRFVDMLEKSRYWEVTIRKEYLINLIKNARAEIASRGRKKSLFTELIKRYIIT